jgi:hypothetical protein
MLGEKVRCFGLDYVWLRVEDGGSWFGWRVVGRILAGQAEASWPRVGRK